MIFTLVSTHDICPCKYENYTCKYENYTCNYESYTCQYENYTFKYENYMCKFEDLSAMSPFKDVYFWLPLRDLAFLQESQKLHL